MSTRAKVLCAGLLVLVLIAVFPLQRAEGQAVIKVSDTVNIKFGILLQPQADWTQDAVTEGYNQNLFIRRARLLFGGQVAKNIFFFAETENSNLGKSATAAKSLGTGFQVLDAAGEWRVSKEFNLQFGLIRVPNSREALKSSPTEFELDLSAYTFTASAAMGSAAGRDTGLMARGYFVNDRLEYRVGAFQGVRETGSRNSYRGTGRLQYNFFDTEVYVFPSYAGNNLGKKKIVAVGAAYDFQRDYKAATADAFIDYPVGGGAVISSIQFQHLDGGVFLPTTLPQQNMLQAEAGYYIKSAKVAPYFRYEQRHFTSSNAKNEQRYVGGLNYYVAGHNFNVKAAYVRFVPEVGTSTNQFTLQLQAYYF